MTKMTVILTFYVTAAMDYLLDNEASYETNFI